MKFETGQHKAAFILLLIIFLAGLFAFFSLQGGHDWGGDFALYLGQTQSLLDGNSEELMATNKFSMENSTIQEGANPKIGPDLYPWGLPILLLPVVAFAGINLLWIKASLIPYFLLSLWISYRLFRPRLGKIYSLWLVALLGFNPFLLTFLDTINSDIPFLFFALLSLLFIEKSLGIRRYFHNKSVTLILTGCLIFFSFLIRTNGIVLLGVLGLAHLICWARPLITSFSHTLNKEWKQLLPYLSFIVCWFFAGILFPEGSGSHLEFLKRLTPGKLLFNIEYYFQLPSEFFEGMLFPHILYGITLPFFVLGIYKNRFLLADKVYLIYCAASLFVFVIWPPIQGLRFIFSLLPFYLYFLFLGVKEMELRFRGGGSRSKIKWIPRAGFVLLLFFIWRDISILYETNANYPNKPIVEGPYTATSQDLFHFIRTNTEKESVVLFFKPRVMNFMCERQSIRVTKLSEIGKGDFMVHNKWIDYAQIFPQEFEQVQKKLSPIYENEQFIVFDLSHLPVETKR